MLNNQMEEHMHLKFDSNKKFLNIMTPVTRIYLFRSILDNRNVSKNKTFINLLQQKTQFQLIFDSFKRLQSETYSDINFHSPSSSSSPFERDDENRLIQNETLNIEDSMIVASLESTGDNENAHQYDACPPNAKKIKRSNKVEQQNCFQDCSDPKKIMIIKKHKIEKNVQFDCRENVNNLRYVTRNSDLFYWILALNLSISGKHFIRSGEPLSDKIMS